MRPASPTEVSAIMLTCGEWEHTRRCLDSLRPDLEAGLELVVVDNASTDSTPERLQEWLDPGHRVRILRSPLNLGFAAGCNLGTLEAGGRYLLYLNNDVVVPPNWLRRMLAHLDSAPDVGLVGPRSNRIAGSQRLEAVAYDEETLDGFRDYADRLAAERDGVGTPVRRVIGFCMLLRREVVQRIGGFDSRFGLGNFEDDDFCLRARLAGFRILQAEDVIVHHVGGRTFSGLGIDRGASIRSNWIVFKRKWGLPRDRSIERFYSEPDLADLRFDSAAHHVPLESYRPDPLQVEQARGVNFLLFADEVAAGWPDVVRTFLSSFDADDDVALMLRVESQESTSAVTRVAGEQAAVLGLAPERCADLVLLDADLDPTEELRLFSGCSAVVAPRRGLSPLHRRYAAFIDRPVIESPDPEILREFAAGRSLAVSPRALTNGTD